MPPFRAFGSWYEATAHPRPAHPALAGEARCDVLVIGAGYTGLSAALELAERGYDVMVLEAHRVAWGASGRNGGHISSAYNKGMGQIAAWVGEADARRLWDFDREAKAMLAERVERHAIACDLRWGYLNAAIDRAQLRDMAATLEEWQRYGDTEAHLVSREEMPGLVASPRYVGGLVDRHGGQLHPLNYALGLARAAVAAGVRFHENSPVLRLQEGDPAVAETAGGRVTARFVILACNAYLGSLSPTVTRRVRPRIMPVGAYMIATAPLGAETARALIPSGHAVTDWNFVLDYYRTTPDHRLIFGGGVSYSGFVQPGLAGVLQRKMARVFPQIAGAPAEYCWGGLVDISLKRLPDLGRVAPNILYAQGFSGHGVAHTGIAGRLMAEAVAGTAERFDVFARIPHRAFPGGRLLRMPALVLAMLWYRLRDLL